MTRYDRQPVEILIEVKARGPTIRDTHNTVNLSTGGLAFRCNREIDPGKVVEIHIPFEIGARVAWCTAREGSFEIGVQFLDPDDVFMTRMVEQVCQIENYKQEILRTEGRLLSPEEAATEWISNYAAKFPGSADA